MANHVEATITIDTYDGVTVPITLTIEWPANHGYYALAAINKLEGFQNDLGEAALQQMISNGDASLLAHLPDNDDEEDPASE